MARIDYIVEEKNSINKKQLFLILIISILYVFIAGCLSNHQLVNGNQPVNTTTLFSSISPTVSTVIPSVLGNNPDSSIIAKSKEAIWKFTNITSQNLTFDGIMNESYADVYAFKSGNSSFWVNNLTGRVQSALWYEHGSKNQNEIIDLDQGLKIAEPYAKEKYPELWNVTDKRGIQQTQKTDTRGDEKVFVYIWQEIFYNPDNKTVPHSEIHGLNSVTIEINPYTGRVTQYHELYTQSEVVPNLAATIPEDQARLSAVLYFESTGIPDVQQSELVSNGLHVTRGNDNNQRLTWSFSLTRTDKNGFDTGGIVGIDAHDGHVVYHATF